MDAPHPSRPPEVSGDAVEIRDADAITINEALTIAGEHSFTLGKSTLQRWAKFWYDRPGGAVRCILVTTRGGNFYKLSRENFQAWLFDQKQNDKSRETPQDLARPHETSRGPGRSRETSAESGETASRIKELENENMQLKIDVGVRRQLLERAKEEMEGLRSMTDTLLRENGALQYQIHHQLGPASKSEVDEQQAPSVDNPPQGQTVLI